MKRSTRRRRNPAESAWATIEYIRPGHAIVEVRTTNGRFLGSEHLQVGGPRWKGDLYELGYRNAGIRAGAHGLELTRFRVAT